MFIRTKPAGPYTYLQVVENHREGARTVQRVLCTLGRADKLMASGATDGLLRSLSRFGQRVRLIEDYERGQLEAGTIRQLGPDLVFGRLWQQAGIQRVLEGLLREREFEFPVERAVYLTVLHRLFESGSDRAAEHWRRDVCLPGSEMLQLHHLYRAMRWLGEVKDAIEEGLFRSRQDLFTELSLTFFDTTSLYFEGQGGESLGHYGASKDHRPDLRQMIVGAVLTGEGRPVCCELWPGDHADGNSLLPVVDQLKKGSCQLVGNTGYRKFLHVEKGALTVDMAKVEAEARYDGKFVLRTNTHLPASEVALQYKRLLLVEQFFRAAKSMLASRPIYHQRDATIRGHVFCSFLALLLHHELRQRLEAQNSRLEWDIIRRDLESLAEVEVRDGKQWYLLRTTLQGVAGKVLQATGVAPPPAVRPITTNAVPKN